MLELTKKEQIMPPIIGQDSLVSRVYPRVYPVYPKVLNPEPGYGYKSNIPWFRVEYPRVYPRVYLRYPGSGLSTLL